MLLPTTREETLYSERKLTNQSENILILWLEVCERDVCFNAWIVNNVSSCILTRISDQSSAIDSDSLHTDNKWNNWTAWKF